MSQARSSHTVNCCWLDAQLWHREKGFVAVQGLLKKAGLMKSKVRFFKIENSETDGFFLFAGDVKAHESDPEKCYLCRPDGTPLFQAVRSAVKQIGKKESAKLLRGYLMEKQKNN